ncbi:hypothetical protein ACFLY0_02185 [Patescibacteria group bacterium]
MKIDISSIIKNGFSVEKRDPFKVAPNPSRDWLIVVVVFAIVAVLIVAYNIMLFLRADDDSGIFTVRNQESKTETINRKTLLDVLEKYKQKEEYLNELKSNKPLFIDPSS